MVNRDQNSPPKDGIDSLLREIRSAVPNSTNLGHRYLNNRNGHRSRDGQDRTCECGERKFPSAPRCPTCAYHSGLIDQRTMQNLLDTLNGNQSPPSYGSTQCQCGGRKLPNTGHCKPCAVELGVLEAKVEPGEEPCPQCGDGKKPAFAYCTGCALAEGYIDQHGQVAPDCPTDECQCGNPKHAAYAKCSSCAKGITGYRHQDWTTGPNPVPIFNPLPLEARRAEPTVARPPSTPTRANGGGAKETARSEPTLPCWRCEKKTPATKRFCAVCLKDMGAPPDAYDSAFNDRAEHEKRPAHMQGRG